MSTITTIASGDLISASRATINTNFSNLNTDKLEAATTATLTNKTYDTAGTGNSFSINGVAVTANTGTGAVARATSPTFVTPTLGVATATSINGATITSGTLNGSVTGTNTGDQTSIVGITGTKAEFDTAVSDGNIMFDGDSITNATSTAHRVFYGDGSGVITELALGADGTFLKSNGATSAPSFATPAGSGDVSKVGTPVNNQVGVWTGDGTLEGDAALTFDTTTDTLAIGASGILAFGAVNILSDSAGTTTLNNIDALDATTEATIEASIDTLANLTSVQGQTLTLAGALITSGANSLTLTTTGATNVTLPTTGTLATLAGSETLSSKTLTAPKIVDAGFIADANGNEQLVFQTTASAVNEFEMTNAATGNAPILAVTGGDTNIDLKITPKGSGKVVPTSSVNFGAFTAYFTETDNGNSSTSDTIDWTLSNKQKSTLTGNCTFTFTAPPGPCSLVLKLVQDGTGSRTVTWPAAVHWSGGTAPTLTTTASKVDIITFYYDGTTYFGSSVLNFTA